MFDRLRKTTFVAIALVTLQVAEASATSADADPGAPDPLAMIRAEHVMISTGDYGGTIAWYRDKLGFAIKQEWTVPEFPGVQLAYLELNGFVLEVVGTPRAFQDKATPPDLGTALSDRGFGHLAFLAADVDAVAKELARRGVEILVPPTSFPESGRRLIFVRDNNGNLIEFLTPLSAYNKGDRQ